MAVVGCSSSIYIIYTPGPSDVANIDSLGLIFHICYLPILPRCEYGACSAHPLAVPIRLTNQMTTLIVVTTELKYKYQCSAKQFEINSKAS